MRIPRGSHSPTPAQDPDPAERLMPVKLASFAFERGVIYALDVDGFLWRGVETVPYLPANPSTDIREIRWQRCESPMVPYYGTPRIER